MTYFPQPNPTHPARRVKLSALVVITVRSEGSKPVQATLHDLSATGGLLALSKALEQGDFVEVTFQMSQGIVRGMAEVLPVTGESRSGCLQPFRFIALEDEDHATLRRTLELLLDQSMIQSRAVRALRFS
jgi:PilZ domain